MNFFAKSLTKIQKFMVIYPVQDHIIWRPRAITHITDEILLKIDILTGVCFHVNIEYTVARAITCSVNPEPEPGKQPLQFATRWYRMFLCSVLILLLVICKLIMENKERTFIMVKPDGVQRGLVGKIIQRFEQKGFKLVTIKMLWPSEDLLKKHYADLASRPFFPGLVTYMSSGPVVPMVWEGLNVVKTGRVMLGETNPKDSAPGTIRGDFCVQVGRNIIHGSDSVESAKKEIELWFGEKEVIDWTHASEEWIYE